MRFLIIVLLLSGCATTFESGLGSNSGGYFEQRISDNNYLVSFRGNKFTTDEKAHFYALFLISKYLKNYSNGMSFKLLRKQEAAFGMLPRCSK